jgi:predicted nucleic acid-binding protein
MRTNKYLVDTNILIYHTQGLKKAGDFINSLAARNALNISILTKVEFLG